MFYLQVYLNPTKKSPIFQRNLFRLCLMEIWFRAAGFEFNNFVIENHPFSIHHFLLICLFLFSKVLPKGSTPTHKHTHTIRPDQEYLISTSALNTTHQSRIHSTHIQFMFLHNFLCLIQSKKEFISFYALPPLVHVNLIHLKVAPASTTARKKIMKKNRKSNRSGCLNGSLGVAGWLAG